MTATLAICERSHVHDQVAAELDIDPDRLRADIADTIREPFVFGTDQ